MARGGPSVTLTFDGDHSPLRRALKGVTGDLDSFKSKALGTGKVLGGLGAVGAAGAVAAGAALAALPAAFAAVGVAAVASNQKVQSAFESTKTSIGNTFKNAAQPMVEPVVEALGVIEQSVAGMEGQLNQAFTAASQHVVPLTEGLMSLGENAMPGILTAFDKLSPVVDTLVEGFGTLGTGLSQFFEAVSYGAVGGAQALGAVFDIVGGLLPILGNLISQLAQSFGPVLEALAPVVLNLVSTLADSLAPIIGQLAPVFLSLANTVGAVLTPVIDALMPPILAVVGALGSALAPVLEQLSATFVDLAPVLGEVAAAIGDALVMAIQTIAPILPPLVQAIGELLKAVLPIIPPVLQLATSVFPLLGAILSNVIVPIISSVLVPLIRGVLAPTLTWLADKITWLAGKASEMFTRIASVVSTSVTSAIGFLQRLAALPGRIREWFGRMYSAAKEKLSSLISEVKSIPGRIKSALGNIGSLLYNSGRALLDGLWQGISSKVGWLTSKVSGAMGKVRRLFPFSPAKEGPFSGRGYTTFSGKALMEDFGKGMESVKPHVRDAARSTLASAQTALATTPTPAGYGGVVGVGGPLTVQFQGDTSNELAKVIMHLIRTGKITLSKGPTV